MTDPLGQSQVLPYLAGLSKLGYEFTLLSFEKKDRYEKSGRLIQEICEKNHIKWVPQFFTSRPPVISKLYDAWKMRKVAGKLHAADQYAFIHCRSYVAAATGLKIKRKLGLPFLFDMRGFWVDERVDNGQWNLKNPLFALAYRWYKKKEKRYFQHAAHIISLTETGKTELVNRYFVPEEKISVIPCCVDLSHFDYRKIDAEEQEKWRAGLGIEKADKILTYLGSLGGWYLTEEMLSFFAVLKRYEPASRFLFITHDKKEDIQALARSKGIAEKDILVCPASRMEVPVLLSLCKWSIFFIKDAYSKKASSPTKQGEIMAMGIPLICNDIGDTGRIVENTKAGIVVTDFNSTNLEEAVKSMTGLDHIEKSAIRDAAFRYYDLDHGITIYADVYKRMTR